MNALQKLHDAGQSVWLDSIRRAMLDSGKLSRYIDELAVTGLTSNPSIFEKAISGSADYDEAIVERWEDVESVKALFYELAIDDLQRAADLFTPIHDATGGRDGFVSLEVSPDLADDAEGTIEEGRRLFRQAGRDNLFIKVPGTAAGERAIEELTYAGVPVNVTLLFSVRQYEAAAEAYLRGLQRRRDEGLDLAVPSVASVFVSRWDVAVVERVPEELANRVGIAVAHLCFGRYRELLDSERWRALQEAGALPQRLLFASTSVKDPELPEGHYVTALAAADTVNTIPEDTLLAFAEHGEVGELLGHDTADAEAVLERAEAAGVDLDDVARTLQEEGKAAFVESFDDLLDCIGAKVAALREERVSGIQAGPIRGRFEGVLEELRERDAAERIWRRDHTFWQEDPDEVANRLGWLSAPGEMQQQVGRLERFVASAREDGFTHVLWSGMGGSSLFPQVLRDAFGVAEDGLDLRVLDSSDPAAVQRLTDELPVESTLYCFASKSGTTAETRGHLAHFWERVGRGGQFVAVTDRGTPLDELAGERGFRAVFRNNPEIGGRYSALSFYGLLPAALLGVDVAELLDRAQRMATAMSPCVDEEDNPGIRLGAFLGAAVQEGRDKCTLLLDPRIERFADWLEQLIAESTGKDGTGVIPVPERELGDPDAYGDDRVFVTLGNVGSLSGVAEGHPIAALEIEDAHSLGAEVMRWEFAIAVAGAVLGVNPFDQPNVEAAKEGARRALGGALPEVETEPARPLLESLRPGRDYAVVQVYADPDAEIVERLSGLREVIRDRYKVAASVQIGPRYLHSTGQLHKGGPDTGVFLQVVVEDEVDVAIPGEEHGFSALKRAQAAGDYEALKERGLRVARVEAGELLELL